MRADISSNGGFLNLMNIGLSFKLSNSFSKYGGPEGLKDRFVSKIGFRFIVWALKRNQKVRIRQTGSNLAAVQYIIIYEKDITNTSKYESNFKNY